MTAIGATFLAVDRIQPVAVALSTRGKLLNVASWGHKVGPPESSPWPNRRVAIVGDAMHVQDLPDGDVVTLVVMSDGDVVVEARGISFPEGDDVAIRYARQFHGVVGPSVRSAGWNFASRLEGIRWSAEARFERSATLRTWQIDPGSIVAHAVQDTTAAISVRRADKRPWAFDAPYEMYVLFPDCSGGVDSVAVPPIDISTSSWPTTSNPAELARRLPEYLTYSFGQARVAEEFGARDIRIAVTGLDAEPTIELSFELSEFVGVRFCRVDRPVNELGHVAGGLRDLNVLLEEDLGSGLLDLVVPRTARVFI